MTSDRAPAVVSAEIWTGTGRNRHSALPDLLLHQLFPHQHEPLVSGKGERGIGAERGNAVSTLTGNLKSQRRAWAHLLLIMLTSLAPSPMDKVTELVWFLTIVTTSAFCAGVTRQHSTDWHCSARFMNVVLHCGLWSNSAWSTTLCSWL